jgi:hypothetical protein
MPVDVPAFFKHRYSIPKRGLSGKPSWLNKFIVGPQGVRSRPVLHAKQRKVSTGRFARGGLIAITAAVPILEQ